MKKIQKMIFLLVLVMMLNGLLAACSKKETSGKQEQSSIASEENQVNSKDGMQDGQMGTNADGTQADGKQDGQPKGTQDDAKTEANDTESVTVTTFKHGTLPIELEIPEAATMSETEDGFTAETKGYVLSVYGVDSYNGTVLSDAMEVLGLVNANETNEAAKAEAREILRLNEFSVDPNESSKILDTADGNSAFWCPMTKMEVENQSGQKTEGEGFLTVYENNKGYGVYVVYGIMKDGNSKEEVRTMLENCAMSLKQDDTTKGGYTDWEGALPDGTNVKAILPKDLIKGTADEKNGICLYFDEEETGLFLIQHYNTAGMYDSEEYLQYLLDSVSKKEDVTCSDIETFRGSMTYSKAVVSYSIDGVAKQEIICVNTNRGEVWVVDLAGTTKQVEEQQENFSVLLESLQKNQ